MPRLENYPEGADASSETSESCSQIELFFEEVFKHAALVSNISNEQVKDDLERKLDYQFHNPYILYEALFHPSISSHGWFNDYEDYRDFSYLRLCSFGNSILKLTAADILRPKIKETSDILMDYGEFNGKSFLDIEHWSLRLLLAEEVLAKIGSELGLQKCVIRVAGNDSQREQDILNANLVVSLVAAVFEDAEAASNDKYEAAKNVVKQLYQKEITLLILYMQQCIDTCESTSQDPVSRLRKKASELRFLLDFEEESNSHNRTNGIADYAVKIRLHRDCFMDKVVRGTSTVSLEEAKRNAARSALIRFEELEKGNEFTKKTSIGSNSTCQDPPSNALAKLNEKLTQANLDHGPELIDEFGPPHQKQYTFAFYIEGREYGRGTAPKKKEARVLAAADAYDPVMRFLSDLQPH
eukprot:CAMPEP_0204876726 /NCGR_PEP_ID=MMETSP1348-20121228/47793_1 /ASSEMBLY_ACC=CAM_ASM_000700 /TAXON_ID=215587 /ORGANISM="Aplanochytrium stocchinoi, Strain GSBS06" /LENGTH=411 /DNA_ID=CAMNT_0052033515 /DNA_START=145 /DNA_END=1380 /DNA_ORIENTATION=+